MTFRVWCPARKEDPANGILIEVETATEAVLRYVQRHAGYREKPFKEITVYVQQEGFQQRALSKYPRIRSFGSKLVLSCQPRCFLS